MDEHASTRQFEHAERHQTEAYERKGESYRRKPEAVAPDIDDTCHILHP